MFAKWFVIPNREAARNLLFSHHEQKADSSLALAALCAAPSGSE
jgi:hypothetical protein